MERVVLKCSLVNEIRFACELCDMPESGQTKEEISAEITEIEMLLTELLKYAEFEYTKPALDIRQVNLNIFVAALTKKYSEISAIKFHNHILSEQNDFLDTSLFRRAMLNLIGNSLRYAEDNNCDENNSGLGLAIVETIC